MQGKEIRGLLKAKRFQSDISFMFCEFVGGKSNVVRRNGKVFFILNTRLRNKTLAI